MESIPVYSGSGHILSDMDRSRISELTQNIDILKAVFSMVNGKLDMNAPNEDGVTMFYLAIQNQEWDVAEYLLDLGADPKLVPPKDRPKVWRLRFSDFGGDQSFSDRLEVRIRCLQGLHEMGVPDVGDKEFIKRLMFVDRCDLKELTESVIKLLSESLISRDKDQFETCCNNDWIDIYSILIQKGRKVEFDEFCYAFEHGSLDFFRMLCIEDVESLEQLGIPPESYNFLKTMVSHNRNGEKINFILNFIKMNNLEGCCRALLLTAALGGCSDMVERTFTMYPSEVFADDINDDLIDEMFHACSNATRENTKQVDRYTGYVDCLKLIITKMASRNDETIDVCHIFEQRDIQVIAETIREDRLDIVERMIRNHDYRHYSTECVYIYSTTSHNSSINLMCCAISCADYGMVEFLTGKGMDISTSVCCRNSNLSDSADSLPPLFCGLRGLLNLNDKAQETVDESKVLANIKHIVEDFAGNFSGTTPNNSHSTWIGYPKYAREREISMSQTITVLDIIISSNDKYSKRFILELLTFFLDFCDFSLYVPLWDKLSNTDFLFAKQEMEYRLFHLFKAGASPEFIRHYADVLYRKLCQYRRRTHKHDWRNYNYSLDHCKALVFERNKDFQEIDLEAVYAEMVILQAPTYDYNMMEFVYIHDLGEKVSMFSNVKTQLGEFLEWYRSVTSSPFTLKNECRTLIRRSLIAASNHRSILKRIELLHLPTKLKRYLIYE